MLARTSALYSTSPCMITVCRFITQQARVAQVTDKDFTLDMNQPNAGKVLDVFLRVDAAAPASTLQTAEFAAGCFWGLEVCSVSDSWRGSASMRQRVLAIPHAQVQSLSFLLAKWRLGLSCKRCLHMTCILHISARPFRNAIAHQTACISARSWCGGDGRWLHAGASGVRIHLCSTFSLRIAACNEFMDMNSGVACAHKAVSKPAMCTGTFTVLDQSG